MKNQDVFVDWCFIIMKVFITITTVLLIIGLLACVGRVVYEATSFAPEFYTCPAQIININQKTNEITCLDNNGNYWNFYGDNAWQLNDKVLLFMSSGKTVNNIYDDKIISVKINNY